MFQILHFSDCHLFADPTKKLHGVRTVDTLASVLATAKKQAHKNHIAIITGDLIQDGGADAYKLLEQMFASLDIPVYAIPGNHDSSDCMKNALTAHPIVWKDSIVIEDWHVVFLNSAQPGRVEGVFPEETLAKLKEALMARPGMPTLIALHHQPISVETPWQDQIGLSQPEPFFKILDDHPWVRCLLFGHIHRPFDHHRKGVRLLGAPATCVQLAKGTEYPVFTHDPPGYRWLTLYPDGQLETGITWAQASDT